MPIAAFCRIRIRSWKDVVLIFVIGILYYGMEQLCIRVFNFSEKTARNISILISFVIALIAVFLIGD